MRHLSYISSHSLFTLSRILLLHSLGQYWPMPTCTLYIVDESECNISLFLRCSVWVEEGKHTTKVDRKLLSFFAEEARLLATETAIVHFCPGCRSDRRPQSALTTRNKSHIGLPSVLVIFGYFSKYHLITPLDSRTHKSTILYE